MSVMNMPDGPTRKFHKIIFSPSFTIIGRATSNAHRNYILKYLVLSLGRPDTYTRIC